FGQPVKTALSYAGISPAFQVLLNARGKVLFAIARDNPGLAKSLSSQSWATDNASAQNPPRRYIWLDNALYIAMAVPIHTIKGEDPTHVVFVGYRVDDQWLGKLLYLVREDASRRQESLAVISAWFLVDGNIVARATSSADANAALPDRAAAIVTASSKSRAAEQ